MDGAAQVAGAGDTAPLPPTCAAVARLPPRDGLLPPEGPRAAAGVAVGEPVLPAGLVALGATRATLAEAPAAIVPDEPVHAETQDAGQGTPAPEKRVPAGVLDGRPRRVEGAQVVPSP